MDTLRAPPAIQLQGQGGNIAERWRKWRRQFSVYFTACELGKKDKATQVAILLHAAGAEALEVSETFTWEEGEDKDDIEKSLTVIVSLEKT
jgi:hypothetical protein